MINLETKVYRVPGGVRLQLATEGDQFGVWAYLPGHGAAELAGELLRAYKQPEPSPEHIVGLGEPAAQDVEAG